MKAPFTMGMAKMTLENPPKNRSRDTENKEVSPVKQNSRKMCVFGACLDSLMENSTNLEVPFVILRLCSYIEKHSLLQQGLYRETEGMAEVDYLKKEFNESGDASLELKGNVSTAMKLLKLFLEDLPEPLIPASMHSAFLDVEQCILISGNCVKHLKSLVDRLPGSAFCVLKYLSHFLLQISRHGRYGSNAKILSDMFGPIIFRPNKQDPLLCIVMKNITHCFMADYHAIFEKHGVSITTNDCQKIVPCDSQPCGKRRQGALYPSTVGPLLSMQPLKVVIPSVDSTVKPGNKCDANLNLPILLIENMTAKMNEGDVLQQGNVEEIVKNEIKSTLPMTRKRKETLLMTSDLLSHDLVEKIPLPFSFDTKELSSENEYADKDHRILHYLEKNHINELPQSCEMFSEKSVNSFGSDPVHALKHDGNHSPHPPDPKRRELEFLGCRENLLDERYRTHHRNFVKYYSDTKPSSSSKRSSRAKKSHSVSLELTPQKGKFLAKVCSKDKLNSDCFNPLKNTLDDGSTSDDCVSEIIRPVSCPVPDKDSYNLECDQSSLSLSWSRLFDDEEPVVSDHRIDWLSRRNSTEETEILSPAVHHFRRFNSDLDSNVAPSPPTEQEHFQKIPVNGDAFSLPIKHLTKKIHGLKKKIKRFDEKYEDEYGYKPSHAEKMNYPDARKFLNALHKLRKELKDLKEDSHLMSVTPTSGSWLPKCNAHILEDTTNCLKDSSRLLKELIKKSKPSVQKSWGETIKTLDDERKLAKRPELIKDMTNDQVKDEKLAIQKVLLHFESIHGKPSKKNDRNTIRPLYDRYRNIKHLLVKSNSFPVSSGKIPGIFNCLQPIMEHETMDFTAPLEEEAFDEQDFEESIIENSTGALSQEIEEKSNDVYSVCFQFLDNKYNNSNLHELPLPEMIYQQHQARVEKRRMRKILREFESEFMKINGRKMQKEDKAPVETLYEEYRLVKARLRLLEALISKHHHEHQNE